MNPIQLLQSLKANPMQVLMNRKYNVPSNLTDPNDIIQHLLNSGQVSQAQVNNAINMRNNPMVKQMFNMK